MAIEGTVNKSGRSLAGSVNGVYGCTIKDGVTGYNSTWSSAKIAEDCFVPIDQDSGAQVAVNPGEGVDLAAVSHIDYTADGVDSVLLWRSGKNILSVNIEEEALPLSGHVDVVDFGRDVTFSNLVMTFFLEDASLTTNGTTLVRLFKADGTSTNFTPGQFKRPDNYAMYNDYVMSGAYSRAESNITFQAMRVFLIGDSNSKFTAGTVSFQVELGAAATDFEPANGQGFTADFGQTVYGGEFNWSSGKLTITHGADGNTLETSEVVQLDAQPVTGLFGDTYAFSDTGNTTVGGYTAPGPITSALMRRVSTLETQVASGEYIPAYWLEYLDGRLPAIREKCTGVGAKGDSFIFFTDHHTRGNANNTRHIIDYVRKYTPIDRAFHGGDAVSTVVGQTKDEALSWLWKFHDDYVSSRGVLSVLGNHEYGVYNTDGDTLSNGEYYAALFKDVEKVADTGGVTYYYVDNPSSKIRYIVLDNDYIRLASNAEQSAWYINALSSMEEGWTAVLLVHTYYDGDAGSTPPDRSLVITQIANDYNNRASGSSTVASWDFTSGKGEVACLLCGHVHYDYAAVSNGIQVIVTTTDMQGSTGDTTEQAVDLVFINTEARTIETIRLGYGEDRSWTY